jgi:hypothetical protein
VGLVSSYGGGVFTGCSCPTAFKDILLTSKISKKCGDRYRSGRASIVPDRIPRILVLTRRHKAAHVFITRCRGPNEIILCKFARRGTVHHVEIKTVVIRTTRELTLHVSQSCIEGSLEAM